MDTCSRLDSSCLTPCVVSHRSQCRSATDLHRQALRSATTARPGLAALLDYARPGDTLVVAAIDRLGRSVAEITRTIADLGEHRITLRALREGVDTATSGGACGGSDHGHVGRAGTRTGA